MEKEKNIQGKEKENLFLQGVKKTKKAVRDAFRYLSGLATEISEAFWDTMELEGERSEKKLGTRLLFIACFLAVLFGAGTVSLARFPLDVYPAGFAVLASLGGNSRLRGEKEKSAPVLSLAFLLTAFSGVLASCIFQGDRGLFYLLSYLILFLVRAGVTGGKFDDSILSRVTFSAGIAIALGLLFSFFEGFTVSTVFAAVSAGILTPVLTYLLCGFYIYTGVQTVGEASFGRRRIYLEASAFTLYYLYLFALRDVQILNFSLSFVLAAMTTLALSRSRGALYGAAAGMIGGMACGVGTVAPALAVGGFFSGLFFEYSGPVAMMIAFVSSCGYSLFTEGFSAFSLVSADYLCAFLLFFPLLRFFPKEKEIRVKSAPRETLHRETMRSTKRKLKRMSDAFSSLSEVFYTVSDTMKKPSLSEVKGLIVDCCNQICSNCALCEICGQGTVSEEDAARMGAKLMASGRVDEEDFAPLLSGRCDRTETLVRLVNDRYEEMNGNFSKNEQTRLLAGEYSSVSRLLKSTAGELDRELEYNPELEVRAKKVLKKLGIGYRRVAVFGNRELKIDVYGIAMERVSLNSDQVSEAFGAEFQCVFDAPAFLMFEESVVMRMRRKRKISLECAKSGCAKKGEAVSGDSCRFFETERDFFYTLICDGMGSGREAAFTSRLSSIFIEKLMFCATPKNVTLEMLNAFLMAKTDETFTTVDLLEVDLLSGDANFIKAGAAPSFVLRGDRLHRIESRTPPAGVLVRMSAEQTAFRLREGDFVIQMSDGTEDAGEGSGWLIRLLSGSEFESAAALCECIFNAAKEKGAFRDDLSVSVVRIMNAK